MMDDLQYASYNQKMINKKKVYYSQHFETHYSVKYSFYGEYM